MNLASFTSLTHVTFFLFPIICLLLIVLFIVLSQRTFARGTYHRRGTNNGVSSTIAVGNHRDGAVSQHWWKRQVCQRIEGDHANGTTTLVDFRKHMIRPSNRKVKSHIATQLS